ncbi:MAG: ATP-binding protein, partial [Gammaproteobacteria bacterium]|nr:ATP-binding protein [Gammaproteobacteria bacterium]
PGGAERTLVFAPISAGWITVLAVDRVAGARDAAPRTELRVRAEWRETDDGYLVEARVPLALLGRRLGLEVVDAGASDAGTAPARALSTSGPGRLARLEPLVLPAESIEALIRGLEHTPGRRIWVVDTNRRVLARGGSLERSEPFAPINPLLGLILRPPSAEAFEEQPIVSHLAGAEVDAALAGRGTVRWQGTDEADTFVVSAAFPVWNAQRIAGAVVVEETTLGIQTVRREALARLLNQTLVVCLVGALVLLLFATRISIRLRRLRDDTERAIDAHGRVVGRVSGSGAGDEIGDLARTFAGLMERLRQYNHYLEQLARRLSHELRTPLAVVRSSLEGMELDPGAREVYLARASDGVRRLETIITRMSEATRLEQALQEAELERFDLRDVAGAAVASYRATWPAQRFEWRATAEPCPVEGVPDLVVQLMDKLVANAVDFSTEDTPVAVQVARDGGRPCLEVENRGPILPAEMADQLFESMVSLRNGAGAGGDPHLGLGLYIVRLIAEFHGARASAENLPGDAGVRMRVVFPRA